YDTAPAGLCFLDTDLRYVSINDCLARINGVPVTDHIGKTVREIIPDFADRFEPLLRRVLATGEPLIDYELQAPCAAEPGVPRDGLHHIQSAAQRAASLTRQLLAFARRQTIQPQVVDIDRLLPGMGTMLRPLIGERVELILRARAEQPAVKVDPNQIEQVVVNL